MAVQRPTSGATSDVIERAKTLAADPAGSTDAALRALIEELHPTALPKVSHRMRSWSAHRRPFDEIRFDQVEHLLHARTDPVPAASVFSMHRDGRIRELAVRSLATSTDPVALPFLVLRCGDWVDVVRRRALQAIERWRTLDHLESWLRLMPLLSGARFGPDRPAAHLPGQVAELYRRPEAEPILMRQVTSADAVTRRSATRLLLERGPSIALLARATETNDTVIIGLAARHVPTDGEINVQAGRLLLNQRSPRLRQEGLFRLLKADGPDADQLARTFMLDRTATVRTTAQRWFRDHGGDVAAFYRALGVDDRVEALLGLGDSATADDAPRARASLSQPPATRRAALRLLARLGLDDDRELFTTCMLAGSEREAREALAWFSKAGVGAGELDAMHERASDERAASRVLLRLAPLTDSWTQLAAALHACTDPAAPVRDRGVLLLRRALNRPSGFLPPGRQRLEELRQLLDGARDHLATQPSRYGRPSLTDELEHLLRERQFSQ